MNSSFTWVEVVGAFRCLSTHAHLIFLDTTGLICTFARTESHLAVCLNANVRLFIPGGGSIVHLNFLKASNVSFIISDNICLNSVNLSFRNITTEVLRIFSKLSIALLSRLRSLVAYGYVFTISFKIPCHKLCAMSQNNENPTNIATKEARSCLTSLRDTPYVYFMKCSLWPPYHRTKQNRLARSWPMAATANL